MLRSFWKVRGVSLRYCHNFVVEATKDREEYERNLQEKDREKRIAEAEKKMKQIEKTEDPDAKYYRRKVYD